MFSKKVFRIRKPIILLLILSQAGYCQQPLSLKDAVQTAVENYGAVKAKGNYAKAANENVLLARREYLPNLNLAAQQDFGTVNGQNGPLYGFGGLGVASSGLPLPDQSWNAAFGSLYLANVNWDVFTFGRAQEKIKLAQAIAIREQNDYGQELFQHQIRVAAAYLNLMAATLLTNSFEKNLVRSQTFGEVVHTRARNQLIAGVDSLLADAEVSNAKISLTKAQDSRQELQNSLAQLMAVGPREFTLDTATAFQILSPAIDRSQIDISGHPLLRWHKSRIATSDQQAAYLDKLKYPTVSLIGVLQTRGSGFKNNYAQDQTSFSSSYWNGITPSRTNYLLGAGITWNLTQPGRVSQQVKAQQFLGRGLKDEYDLASQQLAAQLLLSETKMKNALDNYREATVQAETASQAYVQKSVLYKNGLSNIIDVTQAQYMLVRAETDRDIANTNIWQALLLKAAAAGDFSLFINNY